VTLEDDRPKVVGYVRIIKMRHDPEAVVPDRDGHYRRAVPGPWHLMTRIGYPQQAWCGSKVKGFNDERRREEPPAEDKRCPACLAALRSGKPRSWSRH